MEFDFDLNKVLPHAITFIDRKRFPFRNHSQNTKLLRDQLDKVIDSLGGASCKAQNLHAIITTAFKLQHSDHELYILKNAEANGGLGAAIGMIKVGKKTLFLQDIYGIQHEVVPLCVLDFYVHTTQQRHGFGKKLFEHILQTYKLEPYQVAIDRPSFKFQSFLKKHYGLQNSVSQANKFLVFDQFFRDLNAVGYVPRRSQRIRSTNTTTRPPVHPYQRAAEGSSNLGSSSGQQQHGPPRRLSSRRNSRKEVPMEIDCHDDTFPESGNITKTVLPPLATPPSRENSAGSLRSTHTHDELSISSANTKGLAAQASLYSRHGSADLSQRRNQVTWNRNAISAGTIKSLHASSQDNPLATGSSPFAESPGYRRHFSVQSPSVHRTIQPTNTMAAGRPNSLTSTGNYTLSSVLNSQQSGSGHRGTSWNVFGIPPVETNMSAHSQKHNRTFPF